MQPKPESTHRRAFVQAGAAAATSLLWPHRTEALALELATRDFAPAELWEAVRAAFLIPEDRLYLNVATLGPQPLAVVDAVIEHTRRVAMSYPPAVDWAALKNRLGGVVGCDPDGLVFPRNTTEAMSFVANGLDLRAGDEILTTNHEHIGGLCCWQLAAARHGLSLRQLEIPIGDPDPARIVDVFRRAMNARTRVVSVSHVTFTTGQIMPVRELADLCRERGIISVIDGAHPPGMMRVAIDDMGADFYASSPHKWLLAPQGTGFLYIGERFRTALWPTIASGGWNDTSLGAHRLNHMGTADESRLAGLDAALRFHEAIGSERVTERVRQLRALLLDGLDSVRGVRVVSGRDPDRNAGMVSFTVEGIPSLALQEDLAARGNVRTRVIGEYDYGWMRLAPHIYNLESDVERAVRLIDEAARRLRS